MVSSWGLPARWDADGVVVHDAKKLLLGQMARPRSLCWACVGLLLASCLLASGTAPSEDDKPPDVDESLEELYRNAMAIRYVSRSSRQDVVARFFTSRCNWCWGIGVHGNRRARLGTALGLLLNARQARCFFVYPPSPGPSPMPAGGSSRNAWRRCWWWPRA